MCVYHSNVVEMHAHTHSSVMHVTSRVDHCCLFAEAVQQADVCV